LIDSFSQDHFKLFGHTLESAIKKYGEISNKDLYRIQKAQVEKLVRLEKKFRKTLIKHTWGKSVFVNFIKYICEIRRNILAARPYFRERQEVFTRKISSALKKRSWSKLSRYHFNFNFIQFALQNKPWGPNSKIKKLAKEIINIRNELCVMNMPLAISRARIFYSRTPRSHLSYMDLVQISAEGLLAAIDKFCLPYSAVFRSVVIGRITGNNIEETNQPLIHLYPIDKRRYYRINKFISKTHLSKTDVDYETVAKAINVDIKPCHFAKAHELANIMAATSMVSSDSPLQDDMSNKTTLISSLPIESDKQPDVIVEKQETINVLMNAVNKLSVLEEKLLKLKGVQIDAQNLQ